MSLADRKCVPCEGGTPPLGREDINKYLGELSEGWEVLEDTSTRLSAGKIKKTFVFKDFLEAVGFVNKIADIAEAEGHHPDIRIHSYKKVDVELTTHAIGGLSENDFILAAKIEETQES